MLTHDIRGWRSRLRLRKPAERPSPASGRIVEFVRLLFVVLFAAGGYSIATHGAQSDPTRTLLGMLPPSCPGACWSIRRCCVSSRRSPIPRIRGAECSDAGVSTPSVN